MKKTILVAAVMFLGLTAAAFAQATYSVGSIPVTTVTASGQTERTGDVTFTQISGVSNAGTITIRYGVPITVDLATVVITAPAGSGYLAPNLPTVNIGASSAASGQLVINVPALVAAGSFSVSGCRVAVAGTGLSSLAANLSAVGNAIVAGQTTVTVISSIAAGLASVGGTGLAASVSGVAPAAVVANMRATEGYLSAFGLVGEAGNTTTVNIRFTLDKVPPTGVTLTFPLAVASGANNWFACDATGVALATAPQITSTSTTLSVQYAIATGTNNTAIENLTVPVDVTFASTPRPISSSVISYTATLAPIGTAYTSSGGLIASPIPRFAAVEVGPATLLTIVGAQTTLIIPFASSLPAIGYNTGFSIANTTADPGTDIVGYTGAIKQTGKITFVMYPQLPPGGSTLPGPYTYTTSGTSPGTGLNAAGELPAGSTYTVLLSQLLAAGGAPDNFQGYIMAVTGFTNAHCLYVLSNFAGFTQGAQALVVTGARTAAEGLNN